MNFSNIPPQRRQDIISNFIFNNYDYCYLKASHEKLIANKSRLMIVGSSHSMNGIDERYLSVPATNFSISSQDIYYDFEHIKKAFSNPECAVDTVVIECGYYCLYDDLSLKSGWSEVIRKTYIPIFGEKATHHYECPEAFNMFEAIDMSGIDDSPKTIEDMIWPSFQKLYDLNPTYYGTASTRETNSALRLNEIYWETLSDEERAKYAYKRAFDHNSLKKYENTCIETKTLLKDMIAFLKTRNVRIVFAVFPVTPQYQQCIDPSYEEELYDFFNELEYEIEYINMNELIDSFNARDFVDSDHLSDSGAVKATQMLNNYLYPMEEREFTPKISAIIPTYNREKLIARAIESVLNQSYPPAEIIIVDDGSTDNTKAVIEAISDPRIKYVYQENKGAGAARNTGVINASCDWIAFLDSDDTWRKDKLLHQVEYLKANPQYKMVYTPYILHTLNGEEVHVPFNSDIDMLEGNIFKYLLVINSVGMPTILMTKEMYRAVGGIDESLKCIEDWDFAIKCSENNLIGYVDEELTDAYFTGGSVSGNSKGMFEIRCKTIAHYREDLERFNLLNVAIDSLLEQAQRAQLLDYVKPLLIEYLNR